MIGIEIHKQWILRNHIFIRIHSHSFNHMAQAIVNTLNINTIVYAADKRFF